MRKLVALGCVALVTVVGCSPSDQDMARREASDLCAGLGYTSGVPNRGTSEADDSDVDLAAAASQANEAASKAARAAMLDSRWDRLSNTMTDFVTFLGHRTTSNDTTQSWERRQAADQALEQMNLQDMIQALDQECRKAQA
ncbi:hypothetical protein [Streptomyces sp. NBC_00233]|uniref:hypothetical protein n=1 Tax=Streptomyces sp. NBC_00233 TaxID=2975686 RepID=UPI00225BB689|nr:hypothetical protein [Streptomyces sp. NBC_00233]MCX5229702.1 hypothetical protein [Streptomyces sp. NBC_00233]